MEKAVQYRIADKKRYHPVSKIGQWEVFREGRDIYPRAFMTASSAWNVFATSLRATSLERNVCMIRVLIRKEQPFEIHVIVNPTDPLDIEKIEAGGHHHVGDYEGDNQVEDAVQAVGVYLELEEDKAGV